MKRDNNTLYFIEAVSDESDWDVKKKINHFDYWHNSEPFVIEVLRGKRKTKCSTCDDKLTGPKKLVISHKERYFYPTGAGNGRVTNKKMRKVFHCAKRICILRRHPYASKNLLEIDERSKKYLKEEDFEYIKEELHFEVPNSSN